MSDELTARWQQQRLGDGTITEADDALVLGIGGTDTTGYADAEINDYLHVGRRGFAWRPPLRMVLRARASHPAARPDIPASGQPCLRGTAGFGFWNAPFMVAKRSARLPEAVWFLYTSPPTELGLVPQMPGNGWKAQVVHAQRWGAVAAAVPTLGALAWARLSQHQQPAARWIQRVSGAQEAMLTADIAAWHTYRLDWLPDEATFFVDDVAVATAPHPPRGPLGFVAWLDNQYVVVTATGAFRSGILQTEAQSLTVAEIRITPLG